MDFSDPATARAFFEVHRNLPREGPGNRASTLAALQLVLDAVEASELHWVLDAGCGPGMQTMHLAQALPHAAFLALDLHGPFLEALRRRAAGAGWLDRVTPVRSDLARLPLADESVDLVWCEGAAYIVGVDHALESWRRTLRPGGACAFTEAVWLRPDPPAPVQALWAEYRAMGGVEECRGLIRRLGFELLGDFVLPPEAWWDDYYGPMSRRLDALEANPPAGAAAGAVLAECRREIEVWRQHGDYYGYVFFAARKH